MNPQEPGPPLLLTMIMKQMVMPRTTSSARRRFTGLPETAGLTIVVGCLAARLKCIGTPDRPMQIRYALKARYAKWPRKLVGTIAACHKFFEDCGDECYPPSHEGGAHA